MKPTLFVAVLLWAMAQSSSASVVTYSFTGSVFVGGQPYGLPIPAGTPVSGQFQYESSTAASSTAGNLSIYPQNISNGFTANFGSIPISADYYSIHITNNQTQPNQAVVDIFTVEWWSLDIPAPTLPQRANGLSQSSGIFSMSLLYGSGVFADTSLPSSLPTIGFNGMASSFLSDTPSGGIDVIYSVSTLNSVPEPATGGLLASAAIVVVCQRRKRGRRQC